MSCGVLIYAHNNIEIDYFKIALANALLIKKNLSVPVTLVTDNGSKGWAEQSIDNSLLKLAFDKIIVVEKDYNFVNDRIYLDTSFSTKTLPFYNCNHFNAYELSPYEETLFIDADYLIMSNALNACWDSEHPFMMNHSILSVGSTDGPKTKYIDDFGIRQFWATVIYFRKCEFSKFIFDIVKHIQENYGYYRDLYYFSNGMFRNDYAFSIAAHMLNGFSNEDYTIKELPIQGLLMSWDTGDIHKVNGMNDITLYSEKTEKGKYLLARLKNQDVHIMNKWAINRHADDLIRIYSE